MSGPQTNGEDPDQLEPGASRESMLITTDSFEEFSQEMNASLDEINSKSTNISNIIEIQEEIVNNNGESCAVAVISEDRETVVTTPTAGSEDSSFTEEPIASSSSSSFVQQSTNQYEDYLHDKDWLDQTDHVFILSTAGKPIYSLHGNEDKLATLFGVMQALVSVVQSNQDTIMSLHANDIKIVFLVKPPLILVAASKNRLSVQQIQLQLTYVLIVE